MDVNGILKLVEAGFTKEEIVKLSNAEKSTPKFDVTNSEPEPVKAEPEKAEDYESKVNAAIEKALMPFKDLYNNMAKLAAMPSIDNVEPKGIDDIIDSFFKGD